MDRIEYLKIRNNSLSKRELHLDVAFFYYNLLAIKQLDIKEFTKLFTTWFLNKSGIGKSKILDKMTNYLDNHFSINTIIGVEDQILKVW